MITEAKKKQILSKVRKAWADLFVCQPSHNLCNNEYRAVEDAISAYIKSLEQIDTTNEQKTD